MLAKDPATAGARDNTTAHLMFRSTPEEVRSALHEVMSVLARATLDDTHRNTVELVLAEVLNNVVEHAYGENVEGKIELAVGFDGPRVRCTVIDDGQPMPRGRLPLGKPPEAPLAADEAPEGGFGWFLIRSMTDHLQYGRSDGRNCLAFSVPASLDGMAG